MGKLSTLLVGLFVMGAGVAVQHLQSFAFNMMPSLAEAPIPYELILEWASTGLLYLGGAMAGYAVLAVIYGLIRANAGSEREPEAEQAEELLDARDRSRQPRGRLEEQGYGPRPREERR